MENHPVPQNISSYEFRLVGDMTLKQFLLLAAGIIVGVLIIRLPLLPIIKFPLALFAFILGFLMAFIPINGRPFSSWLFAFVKAVYSPTEYVWLPDSVLEPPPVTTPPPQVPAPAVPSVPLPIPVELPVAVQSSADNSPPATILENNPVKPKVSGLDVTQTTNSVIVPVVPVEKTPPVQPFISPAEVVPVIKNVAPTTVPTVVAQFTSPLQRPQTSAIDSAPTASTTSMISPPTGPNILAGLIVDQSNQPLPATTVEIVDTNTGIPARALRTNKLGQFQIAIPLPPGSYNVIVEKEGFSFDQVSIRVVGGVIPPVIVQAKKL